MQGRAIGSALGPGRNGAISPGSQARLAMDRPSAWARDEDLEEGRRRHDAKAVSFKSASPLHTYPYAQLKHVSLQSASLS